MGQIKQLKGKIIFKHQTAEEWESPNGGNGVDYTPDVGELIIYDPDETHSYIRLKFGNGTDIVKNLPFAFAEKVDIADIINTLTSDAVDHPLSAAQGKELKGLMDELTNSFNNSLDEFKDIYIPKAEKGAVNGVAELDADGKVPSAQLPSFGAAAFVDVDSSVTSTSTNVPTSQAVYTQIDNAIDSLGTLASKNEVAKTDLASDVQKSLGKADTAIQSIDGLATEDYVDSAISAIPTPDVSGQIGTHNTATNAHNDIRDLIIGLTNRLNTLADSDDTTLDQMSEIVAYIKSNKSLIEEITTKKVNVSDIINDLTTNVTNKPLSAAQGVVLRALVDNLPTAEYVDNAVAQKSQVQFVIWGADD